MKYDPMAKKLAQSVKDFYEIHGRAFASTRQAPWDVFRLVLEQVRVGDAVIDVGAGNARLASILPPEVRYIGIEPSSILRQEAECVIHSRLQAEMREGGFMIDGEDHANILPAMNAEADVVGCFAVLHHIPTVAARRNAVKELARILKPGGTAVVTVWNIRRFPFRSFLNWCAAWLRFSRIEGGEGGDVWIPWKAEGKWIQRYVHACTLREFRLLFDSQEWIIERCEAWGRTGPTTVWSGGNLVILARRRL